MPPAISDDESDSGFVATLPRPARKPAAKYKGFSDEGEDAKSEEERPAARSGRGKKAPIVLEEDEEDEEEDEEEEEGGDGEEELGEDEFVVEKILNHMVDQGVIKFQVKWEGYDDPDDITWEPEETLREGAESILEDYLIQQGGLDKIFEEAASVTKTKKRGRQSSGAAAAKPEKSTKRSRKSHPAESPAPAPVKEKEWHPPNGSWEDHIQAIDVFQEQDSATGKARLVVYLNWKNGRKTKHTTEMVYKRCPQKMLRFYENHVRILQNTTEDD